LKPPVIFISCLAFFKISFMSFDETVKFFPTGRVYFLIKIGLAGLNYCFFEFGRIIYWVA
jgi:hypothetical protein